MANILINPGFEQANTTDPTKPLGWTLAQYTYGEVPPYTGIFPIWDILQVHSGLKSIKIDLTIGTDGISRKRGGEISASKVSIDPLSPYKISLYVKGENLSSIPNSVIQLPYIRVAEYDINNVYLKFTDYKISKAGTFGWTLKEFVFYPLPNTNQIQISVTHTWNNGILWLDDFSADIAPANCEFTWTPVSPTINQNITIKPLDNSLTTHVWKINGVQWDTLPTTVVNFATPGSYKIEHSATKTLTGETCTTSKDISICTSSTCAAAKWSLNEPSSNVIDSINNIIGTDYGTISVPGISGNARQFNGTSNYISIANSPVLDFGNSNFTVSAFVQTTTLNQRNIIEKRATATIGNPGFAIVISPNGGFLASIQDGVNKVTSVSPDLSMKKVNDGNWHHLAVVVNRMNKRLYRYIDGVEVSYTMDISSITGSINTTQPLEFGRFFGYPYNPVYFNGTLDEIKIWNRTLSANEILAESIIVDTCTTPTCSINITV